jgi:hypothetical protein
VVGLGLAELVGHVIEADNDNAEIAHPYAIGNAKPMSAPSRLGLGQGRDVSDPGTVRMGSDPICISFRYRLIGSSAPERAARRNCAPALQAAHEGDSRLVRQKVGMERVAGAVSRAGARQLGRPRYATSRDNQSRIKGTSMRVRTLIGILSSLGCVVSPSASRQPIVAVTKGVELRDQVGAMLAAPMAAGGA